MSTNPDDKAGEGPSGAPDPSSYPVFTDKPGVQIVDPVRRARWIAALFALSIGAASIVGSYVATTLAGERTTQSARSILDEMNRRRAIRLESEAVISRQVEQYRRDMCTVVKDHPRTPSMLEIRGRYKCDLPYEPAVPPGWTPPPRTPGGPAVQPSTPLPTRLPEGTPSGRALIRPSASPVGYSTTARR